MYKAAVICSSSFLRAKILHRIVGLKYCALTLASSQQYCGNAGLLIFLSYTGTLKQGPKVHELLKGFHQKCAPNSTGQLPGLCREIGIILTLLCSGITRVAKDQSFTAVNSFRDISIWEVFTENSEMAFLKFLVLHKNLCCQPSSEPQWGRGSSAEPNVFMEN